MLRLGPVALLACVVLACVGQHVRPQAGFWIQGIINDAFQGLHNLGWASFLAAQVIMTISGFLPAALVGVSAGATYGLALGFALAAISTLIGAVVAFLISRSLLRPFIKRMLRGKPYLANLDEQIGDQGWRLVCLLRLSPVMPFAATSYALGLSSIAFGEYFAGTLASLPSLFTYVIAGLLVKTEASTWMNEENPIRLVSLGIGLFATIILLILFVHLLRRAIPVQETLILTAADNRLMARLFQYRKCANFIKSRSREFPEFLK